MLECKGTSLIRNRPMIGPYGRPTPRSLWWSQGGGVVSYATYMYPCREVQGLLEDKFHHAAGTYSRPTCMPISLAPPYAGCETL